jgi:hypothetical protein
MKKVVRNFKEDETNEGNLSNVKLAIVAANNHYAGFGPGTVNIFRQLLGLREVNWEGIDLTNGEAKNKTLDTYVRNSKQASLSDFL